MASRCEEIGVPGCSVTDHGTISCAMSFISAMTKKNLKPIIGCEMYICEKDGEIKEDNKNLSHLVVLSKNKAGWNSLVNITSDSNSSENFYFKPRLSLNQLKKHIDGNIVAFSGHFGSHLSHCIFKDIQQAINSKSTEEAKAATNSDWIQRTTEQVNTFNDIFGKGNFFIEIQLIDSRNNYASNILAAGLRYIAKKTKTKTIATPDSHYARKEDAKDQRVLLCSSLKMTMKDVRKKIENKEKFGLSSFFTSSNYYIPSYADMIGFGNTEEELENTLLIGDMCEEYSLSSPPRLPKFECPDGLSSYDYMMKLLREGWVRLSPKINQVIASSSHKQKEYVDRIHKEMEVLEHAGLFDYSLIVRDIIDWARNDGQLTGAGRGSAAGSLILYLLGITHADPIQYDLLFERFYNNARNIPAHVSFDEIPFLKFIGA
jgi:DNA polymerase-3 subunit alpha